MGMHEKFLEQRERMINKVLKKASNMGIDAGFDLYLPVKLDDEKDKENWLKFVTLVEQKYQGDADVVKEGDSLVFKVGEHPSLPFDGKHFRRFSSKVSRSLVAEEYIKQVTSIGRKIFRKRVYYWSEYGDMRNTKQIHVVGCT